MVAEIKLIIWSGVEFQNFNLLRTLGSGGFGTCYEAEYNGDRFALKKINRTSKVKAAAQSFKSETLPEIYQFRHENIVRLIAASPSDAEERFIVLQYIEGRNLQQLIDDQKVNFSFPKYVQFGIEISSALNYISLYDIVHLDVKPANVMVTTGGVCKLTDFGCCQYTDKDPSTPTRSYLTGTFAYRAPELLKGKSVSSKADIYSLGICLWQLWSREFPYSGMNQHAVIFRVCASNLRPSFSSTKSISEDYKGLVTACWSGKIDERPSATEVCSKLRSML